VADFRLSQPAESDLDDILDWSEDKFHRIGRLRYATLLVQAMQDIADDPGRAGVKWIRTSRMRVGIYHAWHSRANVLDPADRVHDPRHLIVFRVAEDGVVDILGFVHDAMLRNRALRRIMLANVPGAD
jgi:toxin ParE1/3/4